MEGTSGTTSGAVSRGVSLSGNTPAVAAAAEAAAAAADPLLDESDDDFEYEEVEVVR
jgi:hypothetical protein